MIVSDSDIKCGFRFQKSCLIFPQTKHYHLIAQGTINMILAHASINNSL